MSRVFEGVGHGGNDPGAVANGNVEANINLVMALACDEVLKRHGVETKLSRTKDENDSLDEEIKECNAYKPNLAVEFHNNAGGGDGFEIFHSINGGLGKTLAINIEKEVINFGQNSRGIKTKKNSAGKDYFGFIRSTVCPAVIVEGFFVDNTTDSKDFNTIEKQKAFGVAVAKGILKTLGIAFKPTSGQANGGFYRVICQSFKDKNNALKKQQELKSINIDSFLDFYNGYYRVVAGSFKDKSYAEKRVGELQALGHDCFIAYYNN